MSKRDWELPLCEFSTHNLHLLLLKVYPIWVRFLDATEQQKEKISVFHCFFKNAKFRLLQVTKGIHSQECGEIWGSHLSYQYLTKMHCSHFNSYQ